SVRHPQRRYPANIIFQARPLQTLNSRTPSFSVGFGPAFTSAFRRGELFRLTWSDLDVERRLALVRDRKHPRQKKGNDEWVPLIGDSLEVLLRQPRYPVPPEYEAKRKMDPKIEPHPNEYIFRFDKSTASKYFKLACDDKGIVDLRPHDLRHEATSALFEDGWDIPEVAAVTGHKDWRNLKRYTSLVRACDVALLVGLLGSTPFRASRSSAARAARARMSRDPSASVT
ncbi:tyrosine-type recombinase/integrase, partial [Burkholderia sp. BDU5]|uniref:tyrosine-type recombinase/integrase n=1 Tax=Burkholderia sp. BDU5 TaxID=1385590 RepID=UPI000A60D31F